MWCLVVLSIAILIGMAGQDFRFRAISVWLFFALFVFLGIIKVWETSWRMLFLDLGVNAAFLGVQFLCLSIYFSLKQGRWVNIFNEHLGLGDLLFMLVIAGYLSFYNYVMFYLLSLGICLLIGILISVFKKGFLKSIPLAGMQAMVFAVVLIISIFDQSLLKSSEFEIVDLIGG